MVHAVAMYHLTLSFTVGRQICQLSHCREEKEIHAQVNSERCGTGLQNSLS